MTLSKHDEDFANAMALKLRLNREARQTEARLKDEYGDFRYDIAARCFSDQQREGTAGSGLFLEEEMVGVTGIKPVTPTMST